MWSFKIKPQSSFYFRFSSLSQFSLASFSSQFALLKHSIFGCQSKNVFHWGKHGKMRERFSFVRNFWLCSNFTFIVIMKTCRLWECNRKIYAVRYLSDFSSYSVTVYITPWNGIVIVRKSIGRSDLKWNSIRTVCAQKKNRLSSSRFMWIFLHFFPSNFLSIWIN